MSELAEPSQPPRERLDLAPSAWPAFNIASVAGIVGLVVSLLLGYFTDSSFRHFFFTYLVSFCFFLTISLGSLFFVLIQHLTRAGWSVGVRRVAEALAAMTPVLLGLSAPILVSVALNRGDLYRWAQPIGPKVEQAAQEQAVPQLQEHPSAHGVQRPDELTLAKRSWLNPWFFIARVLFYLFVWSLLGQWYWRQSCRQDITGDVAATVRMQKLSAPALILLGLTLTFGAFDLVMSLDPHWYSTIFGVYLFAGSVVSSLATLILVLILLLRLGYLQQSAHNEHFHDLGKWLFGFVFFWGYIAFSQYMLIWYASIPEETGWLARRGASTAHGAANVWSAVAIALLLGNLLIPFAGLLSRHVKRHKMVLAFWAAWLLVFHWIDLYWLIVPELDGKTYFGWLDVATFVGIGGIFLAAFVRLLARHSLRPRKDPRLLESLAFENI